MSKLLREGCLCRRRASLRPVPKASPQRKPFHRRYAAISTDICRVATEACRDGQLKLVRRLVSDLFVPDHDFCHNVPRRPTAAETHTLALFVTCGVSGRVFAKAKPKEARARGSRSARATGGARKTKKKKDKGPSVETQLRDLGKRAHSSPSPVFFCEDRSVVNRDQWVAIVRGDKRLQKLWERCRTLRVDVADILSRLASLVDDLRASRVRGVVCHARALRRRAAAYAARLGTAERQRGRPLCAQVPRSMPSEELLATLTEKRIAELKVTAADVEEARALSQHGEGREKWLELRARGRVTGTMLAPALGLSELCASHVKALGELGHELPPAAARNCSYGIKHEADAIAALKLVIRDGHLDHGMRCWKTAVWRFPGILLREGFDFLSSSPDAVVELPDGGLAVVE